MRLVIPPFLDVPKSWNHENVLLVLENGPLLSLNRVGASFLCPELLLLEFHRDCLHPDFCV